MPQNGPASDTVVVRCYVVERQQHQSRIASAGVFQEARPSRLSPVSLFDMLCFEWFPTGWSTSLCTRCDGPRQVSAEIVNELNLPDDELDRISRAIAYLADDARRRRVRGSAGDLGDAVAEVSRRGCRQCCSAVDAWSVQDALLADMSRICCSSLQSVCRHIGVAVPSPN